MSLPDCSEPIVQVLQFIILEFLCMVSVFPPTSSACTLCRGFAVSSTVPRITHPSALSRRLCRPALCAGDELDLFGLRPTVPEFASVSSSGFSGLVSTSLRPTWGKLDVGHLHEFVHPGFPLFALGIGLLQSRAAFACRSLVVGSPNDSSPHVVGARASSLYLLFASCVAAAAFWAAA